MKQTINRKDKTFIFRGLKLRSFKREIYRGIFTLNDVLVGEVNPKDEIDKFNKSMKPKKKTGKKEKKY